ncbi:formate dehydrogenase accessory sulfurtransferase FdhD [Flavobacteriaceae bacterium R38]|nr:formate dehydrogenase accessory sulfurtransferase FdhD [Flavobacteriaceae bacterium R38]
MTYPSIISQEIIKIEGDNIHKTDDVLAIEEPLEISLSIFSAQPPVFDKNISITMRTPGNDLDLALGFLFTEGIIVSPKQIDNFNLGENTINIQLNTSESIDLSKIERHFYTSSSCGVCGKSSIDAIKTVSRLNAEKKDFKVNEKLIKKLPAMVRKEQAVFDKTGGLHAAAIFNTKGDLLFLKEDVGRHNALDKLIGSAFQKEELPLDQHILLLSGRASFELIQKAAMAGIQFIGAVGAPSSLAVDLAKEFDITLIGFLNANRFNVYHGVERIEI